jgi:hypothetical protein
VAWEKLVKPISPEYLARSGTEHGEQMAVFCWAAQNQSRYPMLKWMFAVPNGGERSMAGAAALKAEGVKKGVADIFVPYPVWSMDQIAYCGLFIEMKRAHGVPSDFKQEQIDFAVEVRMRDYIWRPCFGWLQAVTLLECYLQSKVDEYVMTEHQEAVMARVINETKKRLLRQESV